MAAYLLVWNPNRWSWDDFDARRAEARAGNGFRTEWSCASGKVQSGDLAYLIRLGAPPRGIIASGVFESEPYLTAPFDPNRLAAGDMRRAVEVRFDHILDFASGRILEIGRLKGDPLLAAQQWETRSSGIRIRDEVASALARAWAELLALTAGV